MRFEGKVAIVTGAASGIGLATAQRLGKEGARVVLADIRGPLLDRAVMEARRAGAPEAFGRMCDVSREQQVYSAVAVTLERFGRLDVIVNGASVAHERALDQLEEKDWSAVLSVDLLGAFHFVKQGFRHMSSGSAIVNVASVWAETPKVGLMVHSAAKAALVALTRSAALECQPRSIRVNAVLAADVPPDDVARAILFLCDSDSRAVTGEVLRVAGGI